MGIRISIGDWQAAPAIAERPNFAIGDVHGRDDLFEMLTRAIDAVIAEDNLADAVRITLGDYVDRGPKGMAALKRALTWADVPLPGNHEQFLAVFLAGGPQSRDALFTGFYNGGDQVAAELGLLSDADRRKPAMLLASEFASGTRAAAFAAAFRAYLGADLVAKFLGLPNHHRVGQYLFVHAGIHPRFGLAMLDQSWTDRMPDERGTDQDPLWIRGPFLTHPGAHDEGVVVVHGHTPAREAELMRNRINVDTKAYRTGVLTAVELRAGQMRIIQAIGERG